MRRDHIKSKAKQHKLQDTGCFSFLPESEIALLSDIIKPNIQAGQNRLSVNIKHLMKILVLTKNNTGR